MTNCCDDYGQCTQGRDCPVRTRRVAPHQTAQEAAQGCAPEGGNVWFSEPEPPSDWEVRGTYVVVGVSVVLSLAGVAALAGYAWARWLA